MRSWKTLEDRIGRNLSMAENYLSLVGFVIVVLGGIGVWSVTRVIVQQKIRSVAILKCIGASSGRVLAVYVLQVLVLALGGSLLGLAIATAALAMVPGVGRRVVRRDGRLGHRVGRRAGDGGRTAGLVALCARAAARDPAGQAASAAAGRHVRHGAAARAGRALTAAVAISLALAVVAMWQADSVRAGLIVSGGLAVAAGLLYGASLVLVRLTRPLTRSRIFAVRHAVISLSRPGNQTRVVLMSVGLGCFFVLGVRAVQANLLEQINRQVGENSPDFVLIDVQSDQVDGLKTIVEPYLRRPAGSRRSCGAASPRWTAAGRSCRTATRFVNAAGASAASSA